jgi:hypothetical protein
MPDQFSLWRTRGGFSNRSLYGGSPLFELFNPSRRSNSDSRALSAAIPAACAAISAIGSSRLGSLGVARIIRLLIRKPIPPSRKIQPASTSARNQASWAVTGVL